MLAIAIGKEETSGFYNCASTRGISKEAERRRMFVGDMYTGQYVFSQHGQAYGLLVAGMYGNRAGFGIN